jgi:hypothetical protein
MYIPGTPKQPEGQGRFPMVAKNPYTKRGSLGKPLTTPFFLLGGPGIYIIIYIHLHTYMMYNIQTPHLPKHAMLSALAIF